MSVRNLYRLNTDGSCKVDLEELLNDESSSFSDFSDKYKEYLYNDFINESEIRRYLKSNKEETVPINEATRKELLNLAEYKRKLRAKKLVTHYKGVTTKRGWIKFETNSQYTPGLKYTEYVKLAEDKSMKYFRNYKPREIINLFLSGDIQVYCSCLRSSTKIKLLNGETVTAEELYKKFLKNEEIYVYSTDKAGNFKPGHVSKVMITGKSSRFIKVTLDNGKSIETTWNHPFMMRDGSYTLAENLKVGDSLMPLYFDVTNGGYERVKRNSGDLGYFLTYREVAECCLGKDKYDEAVLRSGEDIITVHHKDYNKNNNYPSNLEYLGKIEHWMLHAHSLSDRKENDKEFRDKLHNSNVKHITELNNNPTENMLKSRKEFLERGHDYWRTEEGRKKKSEEMHNTMRRYWDNISDEERARRSETHPAKSKEFRDNLSESKKLFWESKSKEERSEIFKKGGLNSFLNSLSEEDRREFMLNASIKGAKANKLKWEKISDEDRYNINRNKLITRYKNCLTKMKELGIDLTWDNFSVFGVKVARDIEKVNYWFGSFENLLEETGFKNYNHKIVKIENIILTDSEDVYDLSVDEWNNFYVDSGVILHNCPDFLYKGYKYMAYQMGYGMYKENRFPKIRNPRLEGSICKHLILVLQVIGFNYTRIAKDMVRTKYYKNKMSDDSDMDTNIKKWKNSGKNKNSKLFKKEK